VGDLIRFFIVQMVFMVKIQLKKTRVSDKKINSLTGISGINIGGNC